jgi:hypothetical protein
MCRGVRHERLINAFGARRGEPRYNRRSLLQLHAAPEKQSIQQQQDHCADDRHDPASDVILARKNATDPSPYECAGDAEQNRNDATTGIFPGHQQLCDSTDNQTDD